ARGRRRHTAQRTGSRACSGEPLCRPATETLGWMRTCRGETAPLAPQDSGRRLRAAALRWKGRRRHVGSVSRLIAYLLEVAKSPARSQPGTADALSPGRDLD